MHIQPVYMVFVRRQNPMNHWHWLLQNGSYVGISIEKLLSLPLDLLITSRANCRKGYNEFAVSGTHSHNASGFSLTKIGIGMLRRLDVVVWSKMPQLMGIQLWYDFYTHPISSLLLRVKSQLTSCIFLIKLIDITLSSHLILSFERHSTTEVQKWMFTLYLYEVLNVQPE
jgi:hypothetical protein